MRINRIEDKEADVTLSADELVMLNNIIYFYGKHYTMDSNFSKPSPTFHELAAQVGTAMNLCQYGHMDCHALECVLRHKIAAAPDKRLDGFKKVIAEFMDDEKPGEETGSGKETRSSEETRTSEEIIAEKKYDIIIG